VKPRLTLLVALGLLACGGRPGPQQPAPQSPQQALADFMAAVKAKDLTRMGNLWGSDRGAASSYMEPERLKSVLTTIQIYLNHTGYRVIEGPLPAAALNPTFKNVPSSDKLRDFKIELQREACNQVLPITLVRINSGGWLVYDVHLESAGNPAQRCQPTQPGTRP
jgi:hypothetical protein